MQMTDIQPVPVEVFPGTGKMLFTPVYHIKVSWPVGWPLIAGAVECSNGVQ